MKIRGRRYFTVSMITLGVGASITLGCTQALAQANDGVYAASSSVSGHTFTYTANGDSEKPTSNPHNVPLTPLPVELTTDGNPAGATIPGANDSLSNGGDGIVSPIEPGSVELVAPADPGSPVPATGQVPQRPDMPGRLAPAEVPLSGKAPVKVGNSGAGAVSQIDPNGHKSMLTAPMSSLPSMMMTTLILVGCLGAGMGVAYVVSWVSGKKISFLGR